MAVAEIYHSFLVDDEFQFPEAYILGKDEPELETPTLFSIENFGDGSGNETFVIIEDDDVKIITGTSVVVESTDETEERMEIVPSSPVKTLKPGQKHEELLVNHKQEMVWLHVKNIGSTAIVPSMN